MSTIRMCRECRKPLAGGAPARLGAESSSRFPRLGSLALLGHAGTRTVSMPLQWHLKQLVALEIAVLMAGSLASAAEYPLELKTMTCEEAQACPGGYGHNGMLLLRLPTPVKTPEAKSAHPLFARLQGLGGSPGARSSQKSLVFFFDESEGIGKGYDRMVVDLNGNGDLRDDPVFKRTPTTYPQEEGSNWAWFGPVEMPAAFAVGQWRPRFYAGIHVQDREGNNRGRLQLRAGSYLGTVVDLNGVKQRFGLVDGNCNFRLGDPARMFKVNSQSGRSTWYFFPDDFFLRDRDGNGRFERAPAGGEAEPFSRLVYFASQPFSVALADDLKSIRFEPFSGPTGRLKANPGLTDLTLAWETPTGEWEALSPHVENGTAVLPAGKFHVLNCAIGGKTAQGKGLKAQSGDFLADKILAVETNGETAIGLGPPLKLELTCTKSREGAPVGIRSLFGGPSGQGVTNVRLDVVISGAGGERYSGFKEQRVPPPKFEVTDLVGMVVASGTFEYG